MDGRLKPQRQARGMEKKLQSETEYVNKTTHHQLQNTKASKVNKRCYHCNGNYPHVGVCPTQGKTCNICGKQNHFAAVCRSKQQRMCDDFTKKW